jgi:hypothetical protein
MAEDRDALRARAEQCRRLARGVSTSEVSRTLKAMAEEYDTQAAAAAPQEEAPPAPVAPHSRGQGGG